MEQKNTQTISTGSLKFRLTASSFAGMFFSFAAINGVLTAYDFIFENFVGSGLSFQEAGEAIGAMGPVLQALVTSPKYMVLYGVEIALLICKIVFGSISVAHKLEPVTALSETVMELSAHGGAFNEDQLSKLEEAIEHMDGNGYESLNTGNKELAGLEYAVNGLVKRMHDSYMQQARFVSDASHELRTPIAVIKGYADMLDRWGKNDQKILDESVAAIKSESDRMSYLVEQLLFLARGDCGKTKLNPESFNLSDMMKEICEEYKMIDPAHEYILRPSENIMLTADKTLIKQCVRILTDNAGKYTPEGARVTLGSGTMDGSVFFMVQDNGIGMKASALPYIFDRFYRADDSRTNSTGGSGLGLAIAKWIVDSHRGRFEVISREEIGTRITVVLPMPI